MSTHNRASDIERMAQTVALWPPGERAWWRELISASPKEALLVMDLVLALDATPVEEDA